MSLTSVSIMTSDLSVSDSEQNDVPGPVHSEHSPHPEGRREKRGI